MIIICKECNTNYLVPDDSIGANGKNVKCVKCGHTWTEALPINRLEENASIAQAEIKDSSGTIHNVPAIIKAKPPIYLYVLPFILLILILTSYVSFFASSKFHHNYEKYFSYFKIDDFSELSIENVNLVKTEKEDGIELSLSYEIMNHSEVSKKIPLIKISLLDKDYKEITSFKSNDKIMLNGGEKKILSNSITKLNDKIAFISLHFVSKLDFLL